MPDILHRLILRASPEEVYSALTTAEGVRNWWTRSASLDSRSGEFRFPNYGPDAVTRVTVEEAVPARRVGWAVTSSFHPQWHGTSICFDLRPAGCETAVGLAHRGFLAADEHFAMVSTGWAYYLVSLKQYLETGQGGPNPDIELSRMLAGSRGGRVALGQNSKLTVLPREREGIRAFYGKVLECPLTKTSPGADVFQLGGDFYLGVVYDDQALSLEERRKAIWLELRTDRLEETRARILGFGIEEIEYRDREHFYFQAPGGQVFRLIDAAEDMSKWQR